MLSGLWKEAFMKQKFWMILLVGLMVLQCQLVADGAKNETPEFKDVLEIKQPRSPSLSPDGNWILYTISECNWDDNKYYTRIFLLDVKNKTNRQMTYGNSSCYSPRWKPDGQSFTFLSSRGKEKKTQLYLMYAFGGEAKVLLKPENGINSYRWSPDGTMIAYTARDKESKHEKSVEKKYGKYEEFEEKYKQSRLLIYNIKDEKSEEIVKRDDLNVQSFAWSPNSNHIAFSATPDPRILNFTKSDLYVVNVNAVLKDRQTKKEKDKKSKRKKKKEKTKKSSENDHILHLVKTKGADSSPVWSEDGKLIAFRTSMGSEQYYVNSHIAVIPATGGDIIDMTADFDENAYLFDWKGGRIWFSAFEGMKAQIFDINPNTKEITQLSRGQGTTFGSSVSHKGDRVAYTYSDGKNFPEIYISGTGEWSPVKLTTFGDQVKDWKMSTKEPVKWKSTDGAEITGVLIKPRDFDPKKKYPLLVVIHGGPAGISIPSYFDRMNTYYPIEQWAAKGAVILEPNYRGSAGFGEAFRQLNVRNLGVGDYWDVISGVDHLISLGFVDRERIGSMGWSQGGYISAFITTFSDRFKAVSVGAGISDWVTYYYLTDITPFTLSYLKATPWDDMKVYEKTSPMTYINQAKTPTLIQHGENDRRVPIANAYKLYRGLKDKNIPVKFVIYKGFGHGISKPKEKLAVLKHNFQWFNQYIWNEIPKEETFEEEKEK